MITNLVIGNDGDLIGFSEAICRARDDIQVIDLGAGYSRLPRANHAVDLMTYAESRNYPKRCPGEDRCPPENWIVHDLCTPMPFLSDGQFDYSFCSQTIEDVRDPVGLIREIGRVSRAGFISTIYWKYELDAGFWHHRWLVNVVQGVVQLVYKPPFVSGCPGGDDRAQKMMNIFWEDSIYAEEIMYRGEPNCEQFIGFLEGMWGNYD